MGSSSETITISDNYFRCTESPISLTKSQLNDVKRLQSGTDSYRVSALISGTATLSVVPDGYSISGSTANSLNANNVNCTWIETRLVFPGAHAVISRDNDMIKGVAELQVYFKSDKRPTDIYCICIPILSGNGRGTEYFASLGFLQRSRPSFTTLWTESTGFLQYVGKDLRDRSEAKCRTDGNKITFLVATEPTNIRPADLTRLKGNLTIDNGYTKTPPNAQTVSNKINLISYIPSIKISSASTSENRKVANGYVETAQVKCRPLDQKRDISGGLIYVGGKELRGDISLDKELQSAADFTGGFEEPTASVQGSDLETILGIVLGVVIGLVVIAFVVVWVFRKTETNYISTLKNYSTDGFSTVSKFAEEAWRKLTPEPCKKVVEKAVSEIKATLPKPA